MDNAHDQHQVSAQELRCGAPTLQPLAITLRAGPVHCRYEAGDLRDLQVAGVPLVQRLYIGVRDHQWSTIPGIISDTQIDIGDGSFHITYAARHRQDEVDIVRRMAFTGAADGTISCAMDGEVLRDFSSNRLGFCVLHPTPHCAGAAVTIIHRDGSREAGHFPRAIAPAVPFSAIAAIEQAVSPTCTAHIAFSGEDFEMEDQRNYGDSSFKTYSTPQARPKPALRRKGERIRQEVTLRLQGPVSEAPAPDPCIELIIGERSGPALPLLGLALPAAPGPGLSAVQRELISALQPSHLRATITLGDDAEHRFTAAVAEAVALRLPLEVAVLVGPEASAQLPALAALARRLQAPVRAWLVMPADGSSTSAALYALACRALHGAVEGACLGGGACGHVLSLTAQPPPAEVAEIAFSLHPQVHATDTTTLFDNVASHGEIVGDLRAHCPGAALTPGPITLAPPGSDDPRQRALVGAAWTCASIAALAVAGAQRGVWHETHGPLGVLPSGTVAAGAAAALVNPVWHLLEALGGMDSGATLPVTMSAPGRIAALAVQQQQHRRILIANLTPEVQQVHLRGLDPELWVSMLDETSAGRAMREPRTWRAASARRICRSADTHLLSMRSYALAIVDQR